MFEDLRERLAWRRARRLVARRKRRPWASDPEKRRVLVILPAQERLARPAWKFIEKLGLDPERTLPVVPTGEIAFAPMDFLGKVRALNPADVGRLELPNKQFLREVWSFDPDIALCLTMPFELQLGVIAAASPASFRVGLSGEVGEEFFDLVVAESNDIEGALETLGETLSRIRPTILGSTDGPGPGGRAAW